MEPIHTVIVTLFEPESPAKGEFSLFRERSGFEEIVDDGGIRLARHPSGALALVAGVGPIAAASSVMALGADPRFDLRAARWVVSGIAGGNPQATTAGSVVIADACIDGDLAFEFHHAEMPQNWRTGIVPIGAHEPYGKRTQSSGLFAGSNQVYLFDQKRTDDVIQVVEDVTLLSCGAPTAESHRYFGPPRVTRGAVLSAARFWHGKALNQWAEDWTHYWTDGASRFLASAMEDCGILHALQVLARQGKVQPDDCTVVRAISNPTAPLQGSDAVQSLFGKADDEASYPAFHTALENAWRVTSKIVGLHS